jgi:lipoprotein-anchoring transpeptidase ErfK/SrfK
MRAESSRRPAVRRALLTSPIVFMGEIMRRYLVHAAVWAGLLLSAGAAPAFANALDSQLQPVATPIPRETVPFDGREAPGTIIIRTSERRLYLVLPDHQALRYGVGVGRPGFTWAGVTRIGYKREWPDWTPPAQMLRRRPDLPRHMEGGVDNPLGARAMYLAGTLYRIHGSNEPDTIGQAVSSGCIRMTNQDVIDCTNGQE